MLHSHHSAVPYLPMPPEIWVLYLCFTSQPLTKGAVPKGRWVCCSVPSPACTLSLRDPGPGHPHLCQSGLACPLASSRHSRAGGVAVELCSLLVLLEGVKDTGLPLAVVLQKD